MTFTDLQTRVANETGLDVTTDATIIKAWINAAYKHICGTFNWPWLMKAATIQTVADRTTGTVSINTASTALTFSSAPAASVANQYMIQFPATSDDWYLISAHTGASASATLSVPFLGSSNISGASYILRKVFYSLPSDCDRIIDIRQAISDQKLTAVDVRRLDHQLPDPTATGDPYVYALCGMDTNKYLQVTLYPTPDTALNLQVRYFQIPADMSTGSEVPFLPERFHDAIVFGALALYGHPYIDDSRFESAAIRFKQALVEMKANYNPVPDHLTVIQAWDMRARRTGGHLPWPSNFPE